MNLPTISIQSACKNARNYNLDAFLVDFLDMHRPEEIRESLLSIYFEAVENILTSGVEAGEKLTYDFCVIRSLIESLGNITNAKESKIRISTDF